MANRGILQMDKAELDNQNLVGHTENAVKTHLWTALCTYLIVARIKATYKSPYSVTECATLLSVSVLEKTDIKEVLTLTEPLNQNQNVKERNLFDF